MSYHFTPDGDVIVRCPHGIVCDYVNTYTTIQGERYVTGGDYWHGEESKCNAKGGI